MRAPALLPILVAAVVLAVSGCGSDGDSSSDGAGSSTAAAQAAPAGTTQEVSGTGYRTTVPKSWRDYSDATEGSAIRTDLIYGVRKAESFGTNLVVTREDPEGIAGKRVDELVDQVKEQAATAVGAEVPADSEVTELGGEEAAAWTLRRKTGGRSIAQRQLIAVHDDALYTITLSALADDEDAQGQYDTVVAGWRWD